MEEKIPGLGTYKKKKKKVESEPSPMPQVPVPENLGESGNVKI